MTKVDNVLEMLKAGKLVQAKSILEKIIEDEPANIDALYNLGMCMTELGQPGKAIPLLKRCVELNKTFDNALVALGYAYTRENDNENAIKYLLEAIKINPDNSYALRNLGGLYGKSADLEKAIYCLEKSYRINPSDPMTVYGLGHIYKSIEEYEKADEYFRKVLNLDAPENIKELSKDGLREIAVGNLKSKGLRIDAVFYILAALKLFMTKRDEEVRDIAFEIALKGRDGLDINNPGKKYSINFLEGEYTGLQLVCYMYAGFKRIDPSANVGIDLEQEYQFAGKLFGSEIVN